MEDRWTGMEAVVCPDLVTLPFVPSTSIPVGRVFPLGHASVPSLTQ